MDVFEALQELHKESTVDSLRRPEKNNAGTGTTTRRSKTREVSSRYKSSTPVRSTTPISSRRSSSPEVTRNVNTSSVPLKRATSAERKRPSTPLSPPGPSTPVSDTSVESNSSSKKVTNSRLPEVLWPSTMRSLSVAFQSDNVSIPVVKKEKPVTNALSERTLKSSSNVSHRQSATVTGSRKSTPERKVSPFKAKKLTHQSENSRPIDGVQARLIDHHRWPSKSGGGKLSTNTLTKSVDLSNNNIGMKSLRRLSADNVPRHLQRNSIDNSQRSEFEDHINALGLRMKSIDDSLLRVSDKASLGAPTVRSNLVSGSRLVSPSQVCRPSPSKSRPSTPPQSRRTSPSRGRQSSPTSQSSSNASVLSFVADIKKGKKVNQLEDAHQLRLLYNRQLQWGFANARADSAFFVQKIITEQTLYNVWETNLELRESVLRKREEIQRQKMDLKLNLVLREQLALLEDWALLEKDHSSYLDGAIEDLEASTLRLPVTGGAKVDISSLKSAITSAADMMQTMGSSICFLLSKAEAMNVVVYELAELAAYEKALLNECDTLLSSSSAMQVKEYSLRTQLIQPLQNLPKSRLSLYTAPS